MAPSPAGPSVPKSILSTKNVDQHAYLEDLRSKCPVAMDESLPAWLVASYEGCKQVFNGDISLFRHGDRKDDEFLVAISGGPRALKFLEGDEQRRVHQWWARAFDPATARALMDSAISSIIEQAVDEIIEVGNAELWVDLCDAVPVRAVAAMTGLPWQDREWCRFVGEKLDVTMQFFDARYADDPDLKDRVADAIRALTEDIIRPAVRERKGKGVDDVLARLWKEGAGLVDDGKWDEDDMVSQMLLMFTAGKDTTTTALSNALYLLLTDDDLRSELRADNEKIPMFVEESLRLHSPVQLRPRIALHDTEIEGVKISAGDNVVPLIGSANRDAQHWGPDADRIDLDRKRVRTHAAFNRGPRMCPGAPLARAEVREVVRAVLERMPDIRLDPEKPSPVYTGFAIRAHHPLHVVFTAGPRIGSK